MGKLALVETAAASAAQANQYLTFVLDTELFAVNIHCVREIIEYGRLTAVPLTPSFIRGVINLRGAVVPVVDLRARFGESPTALSRRTCIVIVEVTLPHKSAVSNTVRVLGIMVDAVNEVRTINDDSIEPPPPFGTSINSAFIAGMAKLNERFAIVLAVNHVLAIEELVALPSDAQG